MIIERTEHADWLTNSYLVADRPGGNGVLIDSNGVFEPLLDRVERESVRVSHILLTHHHSDHVADLATWKRRLGVPVLAHELTATELDPGLVDETLEDNATIRVGKLEIAAIHTPGHAPGHLAFLVGGDCFTADALFRGTVGGTRAAGGNYEDLRRSVMERLLVLSPETRILPGHREASTVGHEWETNPFVRLWRGLDAENEEPCLVVGQLATLLLWARDYDGGYKALVRLDSGEQAIVGGSQVERG